MEKKLFRREAKIHAKTTVTCRDTLGRSRQDRPWTDDRRRYEKETRTIDEGKQFMSFLHGHLRWSLSWLFQGIIDQSDTPIDNSGCATALLARCS
jgi:hypothetical protein